MLDVVPSERPPLDVSPVLVGDRMPGFAREWRVLLLLGRALGPMRARIDRDLERRPDDRYFALASLAALLDCRPACPGPASTRARLQRMQILRDLRRTDDARSPLAGGHPVTLAQLDGYLAQVTDIEAVSAGSLLAWIASSAAFATAVATRGPLCTRAMVGAAARSLHGAIAITAHVDPEVLALADLPEGARRHRLEQLPPDGPARLHPAERRYLGFLERSRAAR